MNQTIFVGRIVFIADDYMIVSVTNADKTTCDIRTKLSDKLMQRVREYCKENDVVGIKGVLSTSNGEDTLHVRGDKITFLSNNLDINDMEGR